MNLYTIDGSERNFRNMKFSDAKSSISFNFLISDLTGPEELASKFPKYCKARISGVSGGTDMNSNRIKPFRTVVFDVCLATNKVTGEINETAVKRRNKVLEIISKI